MPCKHSLYGSPSSCSSCLQAPARIVSIADGQVTIDDQPAGRGTDPGVTPSMRPRRRGGGRR